MNEVLKKARDQGVLIIHAPEQLHGAVQEPSGPQAGPVGPAGEESARGNQPVVPQIPAEEKGKYPIDQTDGGEDDDPAEHEVWHEKLTAMGRNPKAPWKSQYAGLTINDEDAISDSRRRDLEPARSRAASRTSSCSASTPTCASSAGRSACGRWPRTARTSC